ncbi:glycosyltransferase 87 family protein [Saccharothrix luteola]|uniref:glycosyltransferase 87 family protein n=1 Tax=Saccharothrix luteola TaxID=2893018 RepID=UPI001E5D67E8|nr:glycosyltransferase 87 family protein [Saccharothrix luteola]MCC8243200.1 glycosyltransferase 87 family protein [Saccharothrix luteola]
MPEADAAVDVHPGGRPRRYLPLVLLPAIAGAVTAVLATVARPLMPWWMNDFAVYHAAGSVVLHNGPSIYGLAVDTGNFTDLPFVYPPFGAMLFAPFAGFELATAGVLWTFVTELCLAAILWLSLGMVGVSSWKRRAALVVVGMVLFSCLLDPVRVNAYLGQINMLVVLLALVDFSRSTPHRWRGIGIGIAAGIKLTPLIFVVYLVLIGRGRDALRAVLAFAGTVAVGFAVLPSDSRQYWLDGMFLSPDRIVLGFPTLVNHSLSGLLSRLTGTTAPPTWAPLVTAVLAGLGLAAAVWAHRRGQAVVGMLVVAFTSLVVSPVTWPHHILWLVPALVWLAFARWRSGSVWLPRLILVAVIAHSSLSLYQYAQRIDGGVVYQLTTPGNLIATFGGNLAVMVPALALLPVWLRRLRPEPGAPTQGTPASGSGVAESPKADPAAR